jgi:two-component system LytT family sensor kinase
VFGQYLLLSIFVVMINRKKRLYWGLQGFGWGTFTLGVFLFNYLVSNRIQLEDIVYSFLIFFIGILLSHFIRFVFKLYGWHTSGLTTILHKVAILSSLIGGFHITLLYLLSSIGNSSLTDKFTAANFFGQSGTFASIYFMWGILYFVIYFFRNFKKEEIKNLTHQSKMNEIQLNKFKSQLNPHFIFNSMNGLRSLIDEDTNRAKEGITQLSNILRHTLTIDRKQLIHLDEELKLVEDYLNLEKIRLEERLEFKIDFVEDSLYFQVPPMLIQTLVENGIKHGVSQLIKGGEVKIDCKVVDDNLVISIVNSGQYSPATNKHLSPNETNGFGLENSRQRLGFIFNGKAKLVISNQDQNNVLTIIEIPKI